MTEIQERLREIERELETLPSGYISRKMINGKERFYLQWVEDGKIRSRYIKSGEFDEISAKVERRKELQTELKTLRESPEGLLDAEERRKAAKNTLSITGKLMLEDREIADIRNGIIVEREEALLPLYLKRTGDVEGWLSSRAIDRHRTNARLLKRALRLRAEDDAQVALAVNGANLTDRYWFRPEGSEAVYEDVRFRENYFDTLALRGDPDGFSRRPSRTPELTNTGSFEKCWKLLDGRWWMYKSGNSQEYFSELFICRLGEKLGLDMAHYEMDEGYIRSVNFTDGTDLGFEPMSSLTGENDDYKDCFDALLAISPALAEQYLLIVWMDTVCYNMDRHTENFGLLRDVHTGKILSMAPNYDNNIALISRGYPRSADRVRDGLLEHFRRFLRKSGEAREMYRDMSLPLITEEMIGECMDEISIEVDRDFIRSFIMNGQRAARDAVFEDTGEPWEEFDTFKLMV